MWKINRILLAVVAMMAVSTTTLAATDCVDGDGTICHAESGFCADGMGSVEANFETYCTTDDNNIDVEDDGTNKVCGVDVSQVDDCPEDDDDDDDDSSASSMRGINRILFAVVAMMAVSTTLAATNCVDGGGTVCKVAGTGSCPSGYSGPNSAGDGNGYCCTDDCDINSGGVSFGDDQSNLSETVCGTNAGDISACDGEAAAPAPAPANDGNDAFNDVFGDDLFEDDVFSASPSMWSIHRILLAAMLAVALFAK
ncbi:MAG: hypothetical protein SGILL_003159 [Bacillariaceae sp.]